MNLFFCFLFFFFSFLSCVLCVFILFYFRFLFSLLEWCGLVEHKAGVRNWTRELKVGVGHEIGDLWIL